mgnify:CR=1 FL=1
MAWTLDSLPGSLSGRRLQIVTTLLPFLEDFRKHFPFQYARVIADSGYESEENYTKLAEQGYDAYIKPSDHEQRKKRRFKKDIGKFQNMDYDAKNDVFIAITIVS